MDQEAIKLAKQILEIDKLRDRTWEKYIEVAGKQAYEIMREIQNGY